MKLETELNAVGARKAAGAVRNARLRIEALRNMYQELHLEYLELKIGKK